MSRSADAPRSTYEELYARWEASNWSATAIDFSADASDWGDVLDEVQRLGALWNYSMFLHGVQGVARALSPMIDAAPEARQTLFLSTQIADEARNRVFLDRFLREVAGQGHDPRSTILAVDRHLTWGFKQIFSELERLSDELRKKPGDRAILAQTVALSHIIVEGVLAIPGEHFIQRYVLRRGILPGFSKGLAAISKDEERHVQFGTRMLRELITASNDCRSAVIETWDRVLPWMVGVFVPPDLDRAYVECFDFRLEEIYGFGLHSLETKMVQVGIDPSELFLLSLDDRSLPYEERAARTLTLVEAGIVGDDRREPVVTHEALEILFEGTTRALDVETARAVGGPIEWAFTDHEPWHVIVVDDHVEAKPGSAGAQALQLEISSGDWAKVAVRRVDPRRALLTRRLRVHGHWQAKAKLAKLFN